MRAIITTLIMSVLASCASGRQAQKEPDASGGVDSAVPTTDGGDGGPAGSGGADGSAESSADISGTGNSDSSANLVDHLVQCGPAGLFCDNRTQVCCRRFYSSTDTNLDFHCTDVGVCGSEAGHTDNVSQSCVDGRNCAPGLSCQLSSGQGTMFQTYSCVMPTSTITLGDQTILCRSHDDCPPDSTCIPGPQCIDAPACTMPSPLAYLSQCRAK